MIDLTITRPFDDEHVFSWIGRVLRINQIGNMTCFNELFGEAWDCSSIVESRVNWCWVSERFGDIVGDARFLLNNCTWLAIQLKLGEISQRYFDSIVNGQTQLSLSELTFPIASVLKVCPLCYLRDLKQCAIGYWHRSHQSPLLVRCSEHRIKLLVFKVGRGGLHRKIPLPMDFDLSECYVDRYSEFVPVVPCLEQVLYSIEKANECKFGEGDVRSAIDEELYRLKFISSDGRISLRRIEREMLVLFEGREDITAHASKKLVWKVIRGVLDEGRGLPLMSLPFIFWLFGSYHVLAEKAGWLKIIGPSSVYFLKSGGGDGENEVRDQHRSVCLEFCLRYPLGTRSDFSRKHYRSFHWLKYHDEEFLLRFMPFGFDFDLQMKLF